MSEPTASPFAAPTNANYERVDIDLGDRSYSIDIAAHRLESLHQHSELPSATSALIVSNPTVWPLHGEIGRAHV